MKHKSGFVSIIGRPNVGKSTLVNNILGQKVAIMSDKPQTTRNRITAIHTDEDSQIVFLDTPGVHKPKNKLGDFMVHQATDSLKEVDCILFMVDASTKLGPGDEFIADYLKDIKTPIILVINKVDTLNPEELQTIVHNFEQFTFISDVIGISALNNKNIDRLMTMIKGYMPEGPQYYPGDMVTDQPEKVIVAEIIREKLLHYLEQEVPHGVAVEIEKFKERKDKPIINIEATIICERQSHKGIIIGKNGRKLKGIGKSAREDVERLLGSKVFLQIWVKVRSGWRDNDSWLKNFGYRDQ